MWQNHLLAAKKLCKKTIFKHKFVNKHLKISKNFFDKDRNALTKILLVIKRKLYFTFFKL